MSGTFDVETLYELLPAVFRRRDAEQGEPLRALVSLLADQIAILENNVDQLHDDQFVETCSPWALPYIGDLVGLEGVRTGIAGALTARAEVADTIAYRRRKGTAAVLEQLARDITGRPARAVEFFELLAATQHLNHLRRTNQSFVDVRDATRLEWLGSPFERLAAPGPVRVDVPAERVRTSLLQNEFVTSDAADCARPERISAAMDLTHTVDVRRIGSRRGRENIPNIGIFLWRLLASPRSLVPSPGHPDDPERRFRFSGLGADQPLFSLPVTEDEITHLAEPINVPFAFTRRALAERLGEHYGAGRSLQVFTADAEAVPVAVPLSSVVVCDLTDWTQVPAAVPANDPADLLLAIDPVLGRFAFNKPQTGAWASFHHGFSAEIGGGYYDRESALTGAVEDPVVVRQRDAAPEERNSIGAALLDLGGGPGIIEVADWERYEESPVLDVAITSESSALTVRAANQVRPLWVLGDAGAPGTLIVSGDGVVTIEGFVVAGGSIRVEAADTVVLRHLTMPPGLGLTGTAAPDDGHFIDVEPVSVLVEEGVEEITLEGCIVGALRIHPETTLNLRNCIVDAGDETGVAIAGPTGDEPAGRVRIEDSTIVGRVHVTTFELASNSIFAARLPVPGGVWEAAVQASRRQEGCVRFCYLSAGARVPRPFRCRPAEDEDPRRMRPVFTSTRFGDPEYMQLSDHTPEEIVRGADDESEMGVFHDGLLPLREAHLLGRLAEYLPFGAEVGVFHAT